MGQRLATVLPLLLDGNYHLDIYLTRSIMKSKIDISLYDEIISKYNNGLSKEKLSIEYGVSTTAIDTVFKKCGVKFKDHSHKSRKYSINENYFDNIDSRRKAYYLGLLLADGCNYEPLHTVKIELQERDKGILDYLNNDLQYSKPLEFVPLNSKNPNHQNTYRVLITNKHMSQKLAQLGMVQNKTLNLKFVDIDFMLSMICGYFDGNGHIEWSKSQFLTIASTNDFCVGLSKYLLDNYNIESHIYNTKNDNTKVLHIFGKWQILHFLQLIYESVDVHIDRKYNKYLEIYNEMKSKSV